VEFKGFTVTSVKKVFKTRDERIEKVGLSGMTTSGENNPSSNSQKNIKKVFPPSEPFLKKQNLPGKKLLPKAL
jgi:hypothetical protein